MCFSCFNVPIYDSNELFCESCGFSDSAADVNYFSCNCGKKLYYNHANCSVDDIPDKIKLLFNGDVLRDNKIPHSPLELTVYKSKYVLDSVTKCDGTVLKYNSELGQFIDNNKRARYTDYVIHINTKSQDNVYRLIPNKNEKLENDD
jgi:hypothetical protein